MNADKLIELKRYDSRAESFLSENNLQLDQKHILGSQSVPPVYRAPYELYERYINELVSPNHKVLELGAGTGLHTEELVRTNAQIVVTDISPNALKIIKNKYSHNKNIVTQVADMETLPFGDESFDVVVSAGSLSYGDPTLVNKEITRVLRPNGVFICVDSLNHNPVYRINRGVHWLRGNRTKSTLLRMPTFERINSLCSLFLKSDIKYFGSISYLMPVISKLLGQEKAAYFSDNLDKKLNISKSAFKFVLKVEGKRVN